MTLFKNCWNKLSSLGSCQKRKLKEIEEQAVAVKVEFESRIAQLEKYQSELLGQLNESRESKEQLDRKRGELEEQNVTLTENITLLTIQLSQTNESLATKEKRIKTLVGESVDLLNEYDRIKPKLDDSLQELASNVIDRLQIILERGGLTPIDNETVFDSIRHQAYPLQTVPEGCQIIRTVEPGLAEGLRVYRRAKVEVNTEKYWT